MSISSTTIEDRNAKARAQQREALATALHSVDKKLATFPETAPEVAGFLKAFGSCRGDVLRKTIR